MRPSENRQAGDPKWLVGATTGHISNVLSVPMRCGHYLNVRVRLVLCADNMTIAIPGLCYGCTVIDP